MLLNSPNIFVHCHKQNITTETIERRGIEQ